MNLAAQSQHENKHEGSQYYNQIIKKHFEIMHTACSCTAHSGISYQDLIRQKPSQA